MIQFYDRFRSPWFDRFVVMYRSSCVPSHLFSSHVNPIQAGHRLHRTILPRCNAVPFSSDLYVTLLAAVLCSSILLSMFNKTCNTEGETN